MHLVHPVLVHFAVAFLVVGPLVESWGLLRRREATARFGGTLTIAGSLALVPTIAAGYLAANSLTLGADAQGALDRHESFGLMLLAATLLLALARAWVRGRFEGRVRVGFSLALAACALLVAATAYLGGVLVYGFGVGVGR